MFQAPAYSSTDKEKATIDQSRTEKVYSTIITMINTCEIEVPGFGEICDGCIRNRNRRRVVRNEIRDPFYKQRVLGCMMVCTTIKDTVVPCRSHDGR